MNRRRLGRGMQDLAAPLFGVPGPSRGLTLLRSETEEAPTRRPVVICVGSGKGGTGKSVLTSNLAVHLSASGLRVLAVDADLGLANLHLLLGMQPQRTVMEVIETGATLDEVAETGPVGVRLAAGGSGRPDMADLHPGRIGRLVAAMDAAGDSAEVVLVDTGAGIGRATTSFLYAFGEIVIVTTPDLTAMTDGYAVIKNVAHNNRTARIFVVVNRAASALEGLETFARIERVSRRFLGRPLSYLGHVLNDSRVTASVASRIPILLNQPAATASACLRGVGRSLFLEIERRRAGAATGFGAGPAADVGAGAETRPAADISSPDARHPRHQRGPECA